MLASHRVALVHECWLMGPVATTKHVLVGWWSCLTYQRVTAHQKTLKAMLCQQTDIFEMDRSELGHSSVVRHVIDTGDSMPVKQQPYRTPMVQREQIAQLIQQM